MEQEPRPRKEIQENEKQEKNKEDFLNHIEYLNKKNEGVNIIKINEETFLIEKGFYSSPRSTGYPYVAIEGLYPRSFGFLVSIINEGRILDSNISTFNSRSIIKDKDKDRSSDYKISVKNFKKLEDDKIVITLNVILWQGINETIIFNEDEEFTLSLKEPGFYSDIFYDDYDMAP